MIDKNQDPAFYSHSYYTKSCAGHEVFIPGEVTDHAIFNYIKNLVKDFKGKSILDIGCGRGELVFSAANQGASRAVGIDFSQDAIDLANQNLKVKPITGVEYIHADVFNVNLNEKFDMIFMTDIVEHLYDEQNILLFESVKKWLKPDGKIIIHTMPTTEFMDYGQYFKSFLYLLKAKKYKFLTYEKEAAGTHVNLQNKKKLASYLGDYDHEIWYDFASRGFLKDIISWLIPKRFLSSNLWAIIELKSDLSLEVDAARISSK